MRPVVVLETPDGTRHPLGHGDLIGRVGTAQLQLRDARVSEAHAMVSLRGGAFHLLALRGRFACHGKPRTEIVLAPGQTLYLARDLWLKVREVRVPDTVMALTHEAIGTHILTGVTSLRAGPPLRVRPGFDPGADVWLWNHDDVWLVREGSGAPRSVSPGSSIAVADRVIAVVEATTNAAGGVPTVAQGRIELPLLIVARFDSVQICQGGEERLVLSGLAARLVSELVVMGGPVPWEVLAQELWTATPERHRLRHSLDQLLYRVRAKLEGAQLRTSLVQSLGSGHLELVLNPGDQVIDET